MNCKNKVKKKRAKEYLNDVFNILQIDIEGSITLKEKFIKIYSRFDYEMSEFLFGCFNMYRIITNEFENSLVLKESPDVFFKKIDVILSRYDELINVKFLENNGNKYFIKIFTKIYPIFKQHLTSFLTRIMTHDSLNSGDKISIGKGELLSSYLSIISIFYGIKDIHDNNFIFYYQCFYERIPNIYITLLEISKDILPYDVNFILSYRFFNSSRCIKIGSLYKKLFPEFYNDNSVQQLMNFISKYKNNNKLIISHIDNYCGEEQLKTLSNLVSFVKIEEEE